PSVPLLAEVPFDPALQTACDSGTLGAFLVEGGPTASTLEALAERIGAGPTPANENPDKQPATKGDTMRYGMPTAEGKLAMHFGHADSFTFVDVSDGRIAGVRSATPPAHAPGVLPAWLKENSVDIIIAGGMGSRARDLFTQHGIEVVVGAPSADAETLVQQHLAGTLRTGDNVCDH
ncbi:MAG TPA: NifB/NifX family molybdenum-iron cluster-binding protein, partial [Phycisphaerae bacterium]|nr:NifB/NifX family molybdenum-iron cluster-binding protein [Phycisphaerae bacterium]